MSWTNILTCFYLLNTSTMKHVRRVFFQQVLFLLVSLGITLNCNVTIHPNRTATYQLSEAPPSDGCETQWMYQNGTNLSFNKDIDLNSVLVLTNQSIMTKIYLGNLKYEIACVQAKVLNKVECKDTLDASRPDISPNSIKAEMTDKRHHLVVFVVLGLLGVIVILMVIYSCKAAPEEYCRNTHLPLQVHHQEHPL
ncbi:hypothetical protein DPEC_G00142020 [Dallia pectoralis]|uniref:Uncharacterized protein n=1 Tax=Dallia pectoralis TaxID=75939 RepID=A0ACC2GMZ8_DALPE|nr:hypothetical protein DPEC_G00142020 [Dallia pectoralis]